MGTACTGFKDDSDLESSEAHSGIPYVPGNPTCQDLGYAYQTKFESPAPGTSTQVAVGGAIITITLSSDSYSLSWSSPDLPIDAVIMKAADGA